MMALEGKSCRTQGCNEIVWEGHSPYCVKCWQQNERKSRDTNIRRQETTVNVVAYSVEAIGDVIGFVQRNRRLVLGFAAVISLVARAVHHG